VTFFARNHQAIEQADLCAGGAPISVLIANVSETNAGGVLQVNDDGVMTNRMQRFYRIKTPP